MLLTYSRLGPWKIVLWGLAILAAAFLLLPIVFIVALSFGSSRWLQFPPPAWTFKWYGELFADPRWIEAALTSAKIGVLVTILSVSIGGLAALALTRYSFRGRETLRAFFLTPMVLPVVVFAVGVYALSLKLGLGGTLIGFVLAHLVLALPFSVISISGALESFDTAIEDAAILCGAGVWEARWRVTIPAIRHGIFSAAIFSFLVSWDEVVVAIFMASPTLQTLPVRIWTVLRQDLTPVIAAASSLLVGLTLILMILAAFFRKGPKT